MKLNDKERIKSIFATQTNVCGNVEISRKTFVAVAAAGRSAGKKMIASAVQIAQTREEMSLDPIYGASEGTLFSALNEEYICISTDIPDHPTAAAVRTAARAREGSAAQAATPEVSSKNENTIALTVGAFCMIANAERQPTAQVKRSQGRKQIPPQPPLRQPIR